MTATRRSRFRAVVSRLKAFSIFTDAMSSWGTKWRVTSGSWSAGSGTSKTTTSASSYPLAAVKMSKSNVTATVKSPQPGAGIALWVTDSGNWWGVVREQTVNNSYNCSTCTVGNPFTNPYANATGNATNPYANATGNASNPVTYANATGYGINPTSNATGYGKNPTSLSFFYLAINNQKFSSYTGGNTFSFPFTTGGNYFTFPFTTSSGGNPFTFPFTTGGNPFTFPFTTGGNNATAYSYFTCNCQTSYPQSIRLLRSVAGTVTQITSWSVGAATDVINAIRVTNSGNALTIKAYSDVNATTQLGSDMTHTATGASIDTNFGIVISPATNGQGDGTGEVSISST